MGNGDTLILEKPDIILNKRDEAIMVHYMMLQGR